MMHLLPLERHVGIVAVCGAHLDDPDKDVTADINLVTCPECEKIHDDYCEVQEVQALFDAASEFTKAYITTALWCGVEPFNEDSLDKNYDFNPDDLALETIEKMIADCYEFWKDHGKLVEEAIENSLSRDLTDDGPESRAGHDFWLTRNGHGAGFWDGDWDEPYGQRLTDAAHKFGEVDLYVGDDGKVYAI